MAAKTPIFEFLILFANFFLPRCEQLFEIFLVGVHRVGEVVEIVRQQFRIGQAHHRRAGRLRQRSAVDEVCVGEMRVPVEIVVDGVIDAAARLLRRSPG